MKGVALFMLTLSGRLVLERNRENKLLMRTCIGNDSSLKNLCFPIFHCLLFFMLCFFMHGYFNSQKISFFIIPMNLFQIKVYSTSPTCGDSS